MEGIQPEVMLDAILSQKRVILSIAKNLNLSYNLSRVDSSVASLPQNDITQEADETD